jgi:hypothetical protein
MTTVGSITNRSMVSSSCIFNTPRDRTEEIDELENSRTTENEDFEIIANVVINKNETSNKSSKSENDSLRSSIISNYLKDVIHEAKDKLEDEKKIKHVPHPPSSPPSVSSRSSSIISHYLQNVITNVADDLNKDKKREKTITFSKVNLNNSTVSASSIGSTEVQSYIDDVITKVAKIVHVELEEAEEAKKIDPEAVNKTQSLIQDKSLRLV